MQEFETLPKQVDLDFAPQIMLMTGIKEEENEEHGAGKTPTAHRKERGEKEDENAVCRRAE